MPGPGPGPAQGGGVPPGGAMAEKIDIANQGRISSVFLYDPLLDDDFENK